MTIFSKLQYKLKDLRMRADDKNLEFDLDRKWIIEKLTKGTCEATGIKFNVKTKPYLNPYYPTIDRKNNNKGYTKDNCWMVCHMFNIAKAEYNLDVFEYWAYAYVEQYERSTNENN